MKRFLDGRDHVITDISFIAHPVSWVVRHKNLGFTKAVRVMAAPIDRIRDPCEIAAESAGDLHIHARGLVLA